MTKSGEHSAVLEHGDKVLIVTRRLFSGDARRHFVGHVDRYDGRAMRVCGYVFVYDTTKGEFVRRKSQRTRNFPLDNHIVVFVLPSDTDINAVRYEMNDDSQLIATDGGNLKLELSEFSVGS